MIITINNKWKFKLLETGGQATATSTHGTASRQFESYLIVGLMTEPVSMIELFKLLSSLTANHFEGMIVAIDESVILTSWSVRLVDDVEDVLYACRVGYKVFMPKDTIEYMVMKERL